MDPKGYVKDELVKDMEYTRKLAEHERTKSALERLGHEVDENLFCRKCQRCWPEGETCSKK